MRPIAGAGVTATAGPRSTRTAGSSTRCTARAGQLAEQETVDQRRVSAPPQARRYRWFPGPTDRTAPGFVEPPG